MILNWLSILIGIRWTFPLISGTTLAFIETVFPFFDLSNIVTMGVPISFGLLGPNINTVSLTLPSVVNFNFSLISSVIYVLRLPVSMKTLVISDFDWPGSTASALSAARIYCPSAPSSIKGGTVLTVKTALDGGFFCLNSLGHSLWLWLSFSLQW